MRGERLMVRLAHVSDFGTIGKKKRGKATFLGEEEGARSQFAVRGGGLVHLVSFVCLDCLVRRTRETRQTRAPDRLPLNPPSPPIDLADLKK